MTTSKTTIEDPIAGGEMEVDWETLCKRLLVANQHGIRVEQESGHRWIYFDFEVDHFISGLRDHADLVGEENFAILKEYGSFKAALNRIDVMLAEVDEPSLLKRFSDLDYRNDLGVVFGSGVQ